MIALALASLPGFVSQFCLLLTWALVHFVWQGCLLAILFALISHSLAHSSANLRYAAGMFILLTMAACLPVNLWLLDPATPEPLSVAVPLHDDAGIDRMVRVVDAASPAQSVAIAAAAPIDARAESQSIWDRALERAAAVLTHFSAYATAAYALGLAVMLTRVFVGLSIGRRLRRASISVGDPAVIGLVRTHAARLVLRAVPAIAWCSHVSVPVVVGVLRPMILLPISLATGLTGRQLEYVLLHELAHIQRYDPLANLLQRLIESLLFFHPAMWWLTRQVNIERENACDDAVLRAGCQGEAYAEALLRVAELCASISGRGITPAGLLAATGENPNQLTRRIMRLFGADSPAETRPATPTVAMLVLLFVSALIALAAWRSPATAQVAVEPAAEAAPGQSGEAQPANVEARVLHFPADRAMGEVRWRPASGDTATADSDSETRHKWQPLAAAQGDVPVPAGGEVQLRISDAGSRDLCGLDQLAPDDIEFLILYGRNVDDDSLSHVVRLTGLRHLRVYFAPITDRGILHLAALKKLRKIWLIAPREDHSGFEVGDGAARALAQLTELQEINIGGSNITESGLAELTKLVRLSTLHLAGTKITDAGLAEIAKIKSLTALSLGATKITPDGLAALKQLPALERLTLGGADNASPATDAGLVHVGALTNLKRLTVANSQITDAGLAHLKQLSRLENLSLGNTKITEAGLAELEPLASLQELRIHPDSLIVTDRGAADLARLKALRKFTGNLRVSDKGLKLLATLPNLEELRLQGEAVTDAGIEHIAGMKSLKSLGFAGCPITDAGLARLAEYPQIEDLALRDTRVSGDGLACLAAAQQLTKLSLDIDERNIQHAIAQVGKLTQLKSLSITGSAPFHDLSPLAGLVNLEVLDCWVSPVNDLDAVQIAKLRLLKTLMLRRTMITNSGFQQFAQLDKLEFLRVDGYFSDKGLSSVGGLKSLNILQLASPYISQTAVDLLAAELPALQTITISDNDPLRRSRERASKQGPQEQPAAPPGAAGNTSRTEAPKTDPLDEQNIVEIRVAGNESRSSDQILNSINTRVGQPLDPAIIEKDVRVLAAKKWFLDVRPATERVEGGIRLTFNVVERPALLYVKYLGNTSIRDQRLAKETNLNRGSPLDPAAIEEGRDKIEQYYKDQGYKDASVQVLEGTKPGDLGAIYMITEGPVEKIKKTVFMGNTITSGQRIKTQIESKPPILGLFEGQYDEEKINEDIDKLIAYYRGLGFFRAKISREIAVDEKFKRPTLTFVIDEGQRYRVASVRFDGDRRFPEEKLREGMALKEGDFFAHKNLNLDLKRLNEMYRAYLSANIQPQFECDDEAGTVTVVFVIKEGDYLGESLGVAR